jgi:hypothetical protein
VTGHRGGEVLQQALAVRERSTHDKLRSR